jgi:hypothetical protein
MSVRRYNDILVDRIRFDKRPYKKIKTFNIGESITKSVYYIDIYYLDEPLYIQIPKCKIKSVCKDESTMSLSIDKDLHHFIERIENYTVVCVYNNSQKWFNKPFTSNKISKCMISVLDVTSDNIKLNVSLSKNLNLYNQYKKQISLDDIIDNYDNLEVVPILHIVNLQFIDNLFICNIVVEQIKVYDDCGLIEYSIIDSDKCSTISDNNTSSRENSNKENSDKKNSDKKNSDKENSDKEDSRDDKSTTVILMDKKSEDYSDQTLLKDEYYNE